MMKTFFRDRHEAGMLLAKRLQHYASRINSIVLGLARGGIPVAFEVAQALKIPLEVFIVREIAKPGEPEVAVGAVASGGILLLEERVAETVPSKELQDAIEQEEKELEAQEAFYLGATRSPSITDHEVLLVDDGLTTGPCVAAAVEAILKYRPRSLVLAAPVVTDRTVAKAKDVDRVVTVAGPASLDEVRSYYDDLTPTRDTEVIELLREHSATVH